jgi:Na+/H+ antiporter NhaD/arsenite permease-like protein
VDFVTHTAPIAVVVFVVNILFFYVWFRKTFHASANDVSRIYEEHKDLDPYIAVKDHRLMTIALCVFAFTVTLLVLHHTLGLVVAFVGITGACLVLIFGGKDMPALVEKIDWHTILFLAGLFVMVGGLKEAGVLEAVTNGIVSVGGSNTAVMLTVILWISAMASAFLDNVPFAAAMVSVIPNVSAKTSAPLDSMAYTLALGADVGGNATPIGASANVVGMAVAQKHGIKISWKEYCRVALPAMLVCMAVINLMVLLLYR